MAKLDRATRVQERDYDLMPCPLCGVTITGTITVAIELGDLTIEPPPPSTGAPLTPLATVPVTTTMRSIRLAHDCTKDGPDANPPAPSPEDEDDAVLIGNPIRPITPDQEQ